MLDIKTKHISKEYKFSTKMYINNAINNFKIVLKQANTYFLSVH